MPLARAIPSPRRLRSSGSRWTSFNHGNLPLVTAAHLVGIDYAADASVGSTSKLSPDEAGGFPDELRRLHRAQVEVRLDAGLGRYD
jgi:hypothetical protein